MEQVNDITSILESDKTQVNVEGAINPIIIGGPHRTAKSETLNALEQYYPDSYTRGKKWKFRIGGSWPDDGEKDSIIVKTKEEAEQLIEKGKIGTHYWGPDTWHLVDLEDALKKSSSHKVYISDVHVGVVNMTEFFNLEIGRKPISFLFYTNPLLVETRLKEANIPNVQIETRLRGVGEQFAIFRENAEEYLFLMKIPWPPINSSISLPGPAEAKQTREVKGYADRLDFLVKAYEKYYDLSRDRDYIGIHHAYINDISTKLHGGHLGDLKVKIQDGIKVKIDLESELEKYTSPDNPDSVRLSQKIKELVKSVEIKRYQKANGRYSLWIDSLVDPYDSKDCDIDPEDVVLDLLELRLGKPTLRNKMNNQNFGNISHHALVNVTGSTLRDGAMYSLGDQLLTDHTHPSLSIGFLSTNGKPHFMYGLDGEQLTKMQQHLNGKSNTYTDMPY